MKNHEPVGGVVEMNLGISLMFIALKLIGVIDWSWGWVLCPLWIPLAVIGIVLLVAVIADIARR